MSEGTIITRGASSVIATYKNVLITVWRAPGTAEQIRSVRAVCEQLLARHPKGYVSLVVLLVEGRHPITDDERAETKRFEADFGSRKLGDAFVIAKKGLLGATARAAITGINLMVKRSSPFRVFDGIEPASLWIATISDVDAAGLSRFAEAL